jgi:hypothetical protein
LSNISTFLDEEEEYRFCLVIVSTDDVGELRLVHGVRNIPGFEGVGHVGDGSDEVPLLCINGGEVKGEFAMDVVEAIYHLSDCFKYNVLCICT